MCIRDSIWIDEPREGKDFSPIAQFQTRRELRDGFGSGRGTNARTMVQLTPMGVCAREGWEPLPTTVEDRWRKRFGDEAAGGLREALEAIQRQLEVELPGGLVDVRWRRRPFPSRTRGPVSGLPLPTLLSQLLVAFAIEFEPRSDAPLALCANTIRVLTVSYTHLKEIDDAARGEAYTKGSSHVVIATIAAAILVSLAIAAYVILEQKPAPATGEIEQVWIHPQHTETSGFDANGAPMPKESYDQIYVFALVKLHNQSKGPLFLRNAMVNTTLADGIHSCLLYTSKIQQHGGSRLQSPGGRAQWRWRL